MSRIMYRRSLGSWDEVDFIFNEIYNRGLEEFLENCRPSFSELFPYFTEIGNFRPAEIENYRDFLSEYTKRRCEEIYEIYMHFGNYSKAKEIAKNAKLGEEKINLAEVLEEGSGEYLGEIGLPNGTKIPLILYIE